MPGVESDSKEPSASKSQEASQSPKKVEEIPSTARPKPLPPKFNSVLRPTRKPSGNASISIASRKPPSSKFISPEVLNALNEPKPFAPLEVKGKFSNTAGSSADKEELDSQLGEFRSESPTKAFNSRTVHSKPRFKQVVQGDRRRNESSFSSKTELEALMSREYSGEHSEDIEPEDLKGKLLKVDGLVPALLPHQSVGVKFMASRENARKYARGGLLADDMGLGKTIQSIALILYRPAEPKAKVKTTLVVVPLAVVDQWRAEISNMAPGLVVKVHHGQQRTKELTDLTSCDVLITNYSTVASEHKSAGPLARGTWYRIIADEAHEFRNPETQLAKAMKALKSDGRRWALTGTPVHNAITDLHTLLSFIGLASGIVTNDDSMKKVLDSIMLRRTQRVLLNLIPPLERTRTPVEMSMDENSIYNYWENRVRSGMFMGNLMRLRQACNGMLTTQPQDDQDDQDLKPAAQVTREDDEDDLLSNIMGKLSISTNDETKDDFLYSDNCKVKAVRELLNEDRTRQTVIFSSYVTMLHMFIPLLKHEGIGYELYYGGLTAGQRKATLARFRDPKKGVVVLLCSLKTAAVGLNLTTASQVIMVEPWWNPQIVDQAVKRVHRLGQSKTVRCIELFVPKKLEERMLELQDKKRELAKKFIEGFDQLDAADKKYLWTGERDEEDSVMEKLKGMTLSDSTKFGNMTAKALPKMRKHSKA